MQNADMMARVTLLDRRVEIKTGLTLSNSKKSETDWGQPSILTPEQIILWLEGHRKWMHEIWSRNPELRKQWENINDIQTAVSGQENLKRKS